jgi:uncharacterized phage infection (PIP) family protein YhgE
VKKEYSGDDLKKEFRQAEKGTKKQEKFRGKYAKLQQRCVGRMERIERVYGGSIPPTRALRVRMTNAEEMAKQRRFEEAHHELQEVYGHLEKALAQARQDRQNQTEDVKSRPVYRKRLPEVQALLDGLGRLPGGEPAAKNLRAILDTAIKPDEDQKYHEALHKLAELKKEAKKARRKARADCNALPKALRREDKQARAQLALLENLVPSATFDIKQRALNELLEQAMPSPQTADPTLLSGMLQDLTREANRLQGVQQTVEGELKEAAEDLKRLRTVLPVDLRAPYAARYEEIRQLSDNHNYDAAAGQLAALRADIKNKLEKAAPGREEWEKLKGEFNAGLETLKRIRGHGPTFHLADEAQAAVEVVRGLVEDEFDYRGAAFAWPDVKALIDEASAACDLWQQRQDHAAKKMAEFQEALTAYRDGPRQQLSKKLSTKGQQFTAKDLGEFSAREQAIFDELETVRRSDAPADAMDSACAKALVSLHTLTDDVNAALMDKAETKLNELIQAKKAADALEGRKQAELQILGEAEERLARLKTLGGDLQGFPARLTDLRDRIQAGKLDDLKETATKLKKDVGDAIPAQQKRVEELKQKSEILRKEVRGKLYEAKGKAGAAARLVTDVMPSGLRKELKAEYKAIESLLEGENLEALQYAFDRLYAIQVKIQQTKDQPNAYKEIDKEVSTLRDRIAELKKTLPRTGKELKKRAKEKKTECHKQAPDEAHKTLAAFTKEVTDSREVAKQVAELRKTFDDELNPARQVVNDLDAAIKAILEKPENARLFRKPRYRGKFAADLKRATKSSKAETVAELQAAVELLKGIQTDGRKLLEDHKGAIKGTGESPLIKDERERQAREKGIKDERQAWKKELKAYEALHRKVTFRRKVPLILSGRTKEEMRQIEELAKAARERGKRDEFGPARALLKKATARLMKLYAARTKLKGLVNIWKKATAAFHASLDNLLEQARTTFTPDTYNQLPELEAQLAGVKNRLTDAGLREVVPILNNKKAYKIDKRRKAREKGLRAVRRLRKFLLKNPLLVHLAENPLGARLNRTAMLQALKLLSIKMLAREKI